MFLSAARSGTAWKAAAAGGSLLLSSCLFGGQEDEPLPGAPALSDSAPRPGWYKGDYGELSDLFRLESELVLTRDGAGRTSLQFIGIVANYAVLRVRGDYAADESVLIMADRAESNPSAAPQFDPWHSGIFDNWAGLSDTVAFPLRVFQDGSFARYESVLEYFDVDTDSVPVVVKQAPRMWVRYRPAALEPLNAALFEYREFFPFGSGFLPGLYRHLDFRGCDTAGKFSSRAYFLNNESRISWLPPMNEAWDGFELEASRWSRLGSFVVLGNFRERFVGEFAPRPWIANAGEYLMRVVPYGGGLMFWWDFPGTWTGFAGDTSSCPAPPPSATFSAVSAGL